MEKVTVQTRIVPKGRIPAHMERRRSPCNAHSVALEVHQVGYLKNFEVDESLIVFEADESHGAHANMRIADEPIFDHARLCRLKNLDGCTRQAQDCGVPYHPMIPRQLPMILCGRIENHKY